MATTKLMRDSAGNHFLDDPCDDECPSPCLVRAAAERRERALDGMWSQLELRRDEGGWRHYLDGESIHCGAGLELQVLEERDDDWGNYYCYVDRGELVRYETDRGPRPINVVLYKGLGGHMFSIEAHAGMRFRWPRRSR